ncbi:MAG: HYC_CC_PP family protein [Aurantibacter sp.]
MKDRLHRIFSCLMALLLLASTTSWTVGKHYCMGHLIDVSFFSQAEDCGMDMPMSGDDMSQMESENSCCSDEFIVVEGQDDLKLSFDEIKLDQQMFLVAFVNTYLNLLQVQTEQYVPHEHYPPPLLVKDIQLLDEVFII